MTTISAATVALAMVLQRYALRVPGDVKVRFLWTRVPANYVWFVGFLGYFAGNGLQGYSLTLGPFFLMGSVFTSMLLFNNTATPLGVCALLACIGAGTMYRQAPPRAPPPVDDDPTDQEELQEVEPRK